MADFTVKWRLDKRKLAQAAVHAAAVRGVTDAAEELLTVADRTIPHDRGTMQGSGTVSVDETKIAAAVAYDTPYAIRQHEDTRLHHPDPANPRSSSGRRAKWLQLALQENAPRLRKHIAAEIEAATRGGA